MIRAASLNVFIISRLQATELYRANLVAMIEGFSSLTASPIRTRTCHCHRDTLPAPSRRTLTAGRLLTARPERIRTRGRKSCPAAAQRPGSGPEANGSSGQGGKADGKADADLSEDVLERLKKAEEEAADLRYQLTLAKDMQVSQSSSKLALSMECCVTACQ